jgi:hypothetical protein
VIILVGRPRKGKTWFANVIVREQVERGRSYIVDPHDEYRGLIVTEPPFPRAEHGKPVVFRPTMPPYTAEIREEVLAFLYFVNATGGTVFLEEIQEYIDPAMPLPPPVARMAFQASKRPKAGIVISSQRAQWIHAKLRSPVALLYVFQQTHALDLKALEQCAPEFPELVHYAPRLQPRQYLRVDLQQQTIALGSTDNRRAADRISAPRPR